MNAQEALQQYQQLNRVAANVKLPALEAITYDLSINTKILNQVKEVHAELKNFNSTSSWLDYQSGKQFFINEPLVIADNYDTLLNAEVTNGSNGSLHVRYNGNGGWIVTTYHYNKGKTYIADKVEHVASFSKRNSSPITLQYLRFWTVRDTNLGMNPVFACFIGFGGNQ